MSNHLCQIREMKTINVCEEKQTNDQNKKFLSFYQETKDGQYKPRNLMID